MKAKWIALLVPMLVALAMAGAAEAGGYGGKTGYQGHPGGYGHSYPGYRHDRHRGYKHGYRGRAYKHGYRGRGHDRRVHRPHYRAYRHGYRKGYRHGYRSRSYYPDAYRHDQTLGHVRGIYFPYSGSVSLHFGY